MITGIIIGVCVLGVVVLGLLAGGFLNAMQEADSNDSSLRKQNLILDLREEMAARAAVIERLRKNKKRHSHLVDMQKIDMERLLRLEATSWTNVSMSK